MNARKGISPIIAAVLLIVVAVSVGITLSSWVAHWIQSQTGSDNMLCATNTYYMIESAEFNRTADYNNSLLILLTNKKREKIYGFGVVLRNGTDAVTLNSTSNLINQGGISSTHPLGQEESVYITVNLTNTTLGYPAFGATLTYVKVTNDACPSSYAETSSIIKGS